jgi:hypothetical protein
MDPITVLCIGSLPFLAGWLGLGLSSLERLDFGTKRGNFVLGVVAHHTTPRLLPWMSTPGWLSPYCSLRE